MSLLDELRESEELITSSATMLHLLEVQHLAVPLHAAVHTVQEARELLGAIVGVLEDDSDGSPQSNERALINITSYLRDCHIEVNE